MHTLWKHLRLQNLCRAQPLHPCVLHTAQELFGALCEQNRTGNSHLLYFFLLFSKARFLCVTTLVVLELALQTRLVLNSQRTACLCLLSAGIKGVHHYRPVERAILNDG